MLYKYTLYDIEHSSSKCYFNEHSRVNFAGAIAANRPRMCAEIQSAIGYRHCGICLSLPCFFDGDGEQRLTGSMHAQGESNISPRSAFLTNETLNALTLVNFLTQPMNIRPMP